MRRFNFKIEFRYLTGEGNIIFYRKILGKLANTPIDTATISALKRIPNLALGDFKIVRDRFLYYRSEQINHRLLLQALQDEGRMKQVHNVTSF